MSNFYSDDEKKKNPRKDEIDVKWGIIQVEIKNGNGLAIRDTISNLKETDPGMANAIYWRLHGWFASYFGRLPLSEVDKDFGTTPKQAGLRMFSEYMRTRTTNPDPEMFNTCDISRLLSELPDLNTSGPYGDDYTADEAVRLRALGKDLFPLFLKYTKHGTTPKDWIAQLKYFAKKHGFIDRVENEIERLREDKKREADNVRP